MFPTPLDDRCWSGGLLQLHFWSQRAGRNYCYRGMYCVFLLDPMNKNYASFNTPILCSSRTDNIPNLIIYIIVLVWCSVLWCMEIFNSSISVSRWKGHWGLYFWMASRSVNHKQIIIMALENLISNMWYWPFWDSDIHGPRRGFNSTNIGGKISKCQLLCLK